jgi:hypothetical protein
MMAVTLTYGVTVVTLPDDLLWLDEFDWRAVEGKWSHSIAGALLFDRGAKLDGRPMTLGGNGDDECWTTRDVVETLFAWSALPAAQFTLSYRSVSHNVVFDPSQQPIEAKPVVDFHSYDSTDFYTVKLRLLKKAV